MHKIFIHISLFFFLGLNSIWAQSELEWKLIQAAENGNTKELTELLRKGINVNCKTPEGATPLFLAAQNGHLSEVSLLLQRNANPNIARKDGITPLISAVLSGSYEISEKLLLNGANSNTASTDGNTAMLSAIYFGYWDIMELLYSKGAKLKRGKLDLAHVAAYHNDTTALSFLKKHHYPINNKDEFGNYATHYAAQENAEEALKWLLKNEAKTDVLNNAQMSPLALSIQNNNNSMTDVLIKQKFNPKQKPYFKMDLYTFALAHNNNYAAKKLRSNGVKAGSTFKFHEANIGLGMIFNYQDFYIGTVASINELSTNTMFQFSFYTRAARKPIWVQTNDHFFWQYNEYRMFMTFGLIKKFSIRINSNVALEPYAGIHYLFSAAGYKGTNSDPNSLSSYSYNAGFQIRKSNHVMRFSYENLDFKTYKLIPHKVSFTYLYTIKLLNTQKYENALNLL